MSDITKIKESVLNRIKEDDLVALSRELVKIPSETGNEKDVADWLGNYLKGMGLKVQFAEGERDRPNVIGKLPGKTGKPCIMFSGHMDTVGPGDLKKWKTDPYAGEVVGRRMYGRGVMDSKGGGIASVAVAIKAIMDEGIQLDGDVFIVGTVDEEVGGTYGMKHVMDSQIITPDLVVYCVHSDMEIKAHWKSRMTVKVDVHGSTAHGSTPAEGLNAILKAIPIIERLKKGSPFETHSILGEHTVNIGWLRAGSETKYNVVPDLCTFGIDMRLVHGQTIEDSFDKIQSILADMMKEDPDLDVTAELGFSKKGGSLDDSDPALQLVKRSALEVLGAAPEVSGTISPGDLSHVFSKGIKGVGFGPGDLKKGNAHKENEFIDIDELVDASKIYATIMLNYCL